VVRKSKRWKRRNRRKNRRIYSAYWIAENSLYHNNVFFYTVGVRGCLELRFSRVTMVGGTVVHG